MCLKVNSAGERELAFLGQREHASFVARHDLEHQPVLILRVRVGCDENSTNGGAHGACFGSDHRLLDSPVLGSDGWRLVFVHDCDGNLRVHSTRPDQVACDDAVVGHTDGQ